MKGILPVIEGFADALRDEVVTVRVGVEGDGFQGVDIHFAVLHLVGLHGGLQHLADNAETSIITLVFNKFALHSYGQFVDDGSIHQ